VTARERIMRQPIIRRVRGKKLYKYFLVTRWKGRFTSPYGKTLPWKPRVWMVHTGPLYICQYGLHVWIGARAAREYKHWHVKTHLWEVEVRGVKPDYLPFPADKIVTQAVRLVKRVR
jgi:hypothetical protein